jgi:hypothetical protein
MQTSVAPQPSVNDDGLSLAERRPRRLHRQAPKRFRDDMPQPQPPVMSMPGM